MRIPGARVALIGCLVLSGCLAAASLEPHRPKTRGPSPVLDKKVVILSGDWGPEFLALCSRPSRPIDSYWDPSPELVARLDRILTENIGSRGSCSLPRPASYYWRQYIGIRVQGRTQVYINGLLLPDSIEDQVPGRRDLPLPVHVCEGSEFNWGLVFDLKDDKFLTLRLNDGDSPGTGRTINCLK